MIEMTQFDLIDPALSGRLCLTLLHSLWQVALLVCVVWLIERVWLKQSVRGSYALHVGALVIGIAALPFTFAVVHFPESATEATTAFQEDVTDAVTTPLSEALPKAVEELPPVVDFREPARGLEVSAVTANSPSAPMPVATMDRKWSTLWPNMAPWVVGMYAIGVVLMFMRLIAGVLQAQRLSRQARPITEGPLFEALRRLADQWSLRVVPVLAQAEKIVVPKVVGLLKPAILLPTSALTGLSSEELEMILAHELAHVQRYDMWINLVQRLAEVVLFFNPALWYLSRKISTLREYCCDELTCQTQSGSHAEPQLRYAAALLRIAELGVSGESTAEKLATLAASGRSPSELRRRVARLFGEPLREPLRLSRGGLLALGVVALFVVLGPTVWPTRAQTTDGTSVPKQENELSNASTIKPFSFGGKVEILAIGTYGEEPTSWWNAEGALVPLPPYRVQGAEVGVQDGAVRRQVVFRIRELPSDATVDWKLDGTGASVNGEVVLDGIDTPAGYFSKVFSTSVGNDAFGLRVGVANGGWVTAASHDGQGTLAVGRADKKGIVFSGTFSRKDKVGDTTVTIVSHNFSDSDTRVVAIDQRGKRYTASVIRRSTASAGTVNQTQYSFRDIKTNEIARLEFQVRKIEWVVIEGLPVNPDKESGNIRQANAAFPLPVEQVGTSEKKNDTRLPLATITGHIVTEDGSPATVKGWLYSAVNAGKGDSWLSTEGEFSNAFSIEVHPGTVWLSHFPDSMAPAWVGPIELKPGETLDDVTIVLKPGFSELVQVRNDSGKPVADAIIVVHPEINGSTDGPNIAQVTDENGELLLTHLADTRYSLTITAAGYEPLRTAPLRVEPDARLRPTMIRSKPNTGVVRFADGTPSPGAKLFCKVEISGDSGEHKVTGFNGDYGKLFTTTDYTSIGSEGRFSLDQLAAGSHYLFVVEAVDGARAIVTNLQAGQENVQIVLPQRCDLFVKIIGDLSDLPKRRGKPYVSVRQRFEFRPTPVKQYGALIGRDVPIESTSDGGTAIFRGLAVDLNKNVGTQQVEVSLNYPNGPTKTVDLNLNGGTRVEFDLTGGATDEKAPLRQTAKPPFKNATHSRSSVSVKDHSAIWFHSGEHVHFVLYYKGYLQSGMSYSEWSELGDDGFEFPRWKYQGHVNALNVRSEVVVSEPDYTAGIPAADNILSRDRRFPVVFEPRPPGYLLYLDGKTYDLGKGRVFVLNAEGAVEQLQIDPPPSGPKDIEALAKLVDDARAKVEKTPCLQVREVRVLTSDEEIEAAEVDSTISVGSWSRQPGQTETLAWPSDDPALFTERDVVDATAKQVGKDEDVYGVEIKITPAAGQRLYEATKQIIQSKNEDTRLAIMLDGVVLMAPRVVGAIRQELLISGRYTKEEATELAKKIIPKDEAEEKKADEDEESEDIDDAESDDQSSSLSVVVAKHVALLEGKEIITWEQLDERIAALPDPSLVHPHFYITQAARGAEGGKLAKDELVRLQRKYKFEKRSEGNLRPRSESRYDRIRTEDDLRPDRALKMIDTVVNQEGEPVADVEVVLITPVDASISYKTYQMALVAGRVRNRLEHVMAESNAVGQFELFPPKDQKFYIAAIHPDAGFALVRSDQFTPGGEIKLKPWSAMVIAIDEEPNHRQTVSLSTQVDAVNGWPKIEFNQYWGDLKDETQTKEFSYTHIPPIRKTGVRRSFREPQGGRSHSLSWDVSVSLRPGEVRRLELGRLSEQQRATLARFASLIDLEDVGADADSEKNGQ